MGRILGLDLGTNSIGWAIVDENGDGAYKLIDKGVNIFQEGVKIEKGIESSKAADRTAHRHSRRHYFRRKLRKIEVLKVLKENNLCPFLTQEQLDNWRYKREYPLVEDFILWQRTNDNEDKNPYHDRYICLTQKLNLDLKSDRYILGRALYHLAQRRGFLSNRLEKTKESDGDVKRGIETLQKQIKEEGCNYLGEYFYKLYGKKRIRNTYTARAEYKAEFDAICNKQEISEGLKEKLVRAIFFQRPLKSQKGTVGRCKFETSKSRVPISHPRFEEFRMYSFINNIKIKTPNDSDLRPLNDEEKERILPQFFRRSKKNFHFEDIARCFTRRKDSYAFYKDENADHKPFLFNYPMYTSVSGCPIISQFKNIFGDNWEEAIIAQYDGKRSKSNEQKINDVWHVLFFFDSEEKIKHWAINNLHLSEEQAEIFAKISMPQDYSSLSLNAINKMLPYLKRGFIYSHAVFMANMQKIVPANIWNNFENQQIIEEEIGKIINDTASIEGTIEKRIEDFLIDNFGISRDRLNYLYHPSQMELFEKIAHNALLKLNSPRTNSVRNPMAMRALFRLRVLINQLLIDGEIDRNTKIHIEFARELNDANKRKAIEQYQREREKENEHYTKRIEEHFSEVGISREPNKTEILKYRLWEEQGHTCLYTGDRISLNDFLGENPKYDIEHTIPRSLGGEDAQENKTLCRCDFNRDIKKNRLPQDLLNIAEILVRIDQNAVYSSHRINELKAQIERLTGGSYSSKEVKDKSIQKRRRLEIERDYLQNKYNKFKIKELKEGYRKNQDIDNSIIAKYGREYLTSLFYREVIHNGKVEKRSNVYTIKGHTTYQFRKMWGLQGDEKKNRRKFSNHTIDAIVVACIGRGEYQKMANYYHKLDEVEWYGGNKPSFEKPWKTFTEDVKNVDKDMLVYHYTPDNTIKQTYKKIRKRGIIQKGKDAEPLYMKGDTARAQLHLDTFYGAIKKDGELKYVVRKPLSSLKKKDVKNIVDDVVRAKVEAETDGFKPKDTLAGVRVWMNKEKEIEIKKVRILVPSVTNPIKLKKQRDVSRFDYKQDFFVVNDSNYCMAIYEGEKRGKLARDFEILNSLEAVKIATSEAKKNIVFPQIKNGLNFKCLYKTGNLVLIYDNSPEELLDADCQELSKRMYKIIGMELDGRVKLKHHLESRIDDEIKRDYSIENKDAAPKQLTRGDSKFDSNKYQPYLHLSRMSQNFLVQNYDFKISPNGKIKFLNR